MDARTGSELELVSYSVNSCLICKFDTLARVFANFRAFLDQMLNDFGVGPRRMMPLNTMTCPLSYGTFTAHFG